MTVAMRAAGCAILAILAIAAAPQTEAANRYSFRDPVSVIVNNVGPFNNPAETYEYYSLPFCAPKDLQSEDENLGAVLAGDRRVNSLYDIRFGVDVEWQALCRFRLSQDEIKAFVDAIQRHYVFEMFVDDLPVRGFVGEVERYSRRFDNHYHNETHVYLFAHLDFSIAYNGNRIIAVNLTTDPMQRLLLEFGKDTPVEFSFSVHWKKTSVAFLDRMSLHQKSAIGDQEVEIHWLSIINSFVLVLLLTSFLAIILMRVLRKDLAMYMDDDDEEAAAAEEEESGWKLLHADVFRMPPNVMLFSAMVGNGAQILALIANILILSMVGTFYPGNRGALYSAAIVLYALTASIAGYIATKMYVEMGGKRWATNAVLTACLFAVPAFAIFSIVNTVAVTYGSTSALPFGTIFLIIALWALVTFPLTVLGSMRGKNAAGKFEAPGKTTRVAREIPPTPWYRTAPAQMFVAGFLPFSAIYIELHYVFTSVWGHRVYTLFGILSLAFVMLLIVTAFITVALTYFQLASEDYRWWWRSFLSGGSTGVFIYAYAAFFFLERSPMSGVLQGTFFFGYMFMVAYAFFLMLGSVGYWMALRFVRKIYGSIKVD
eukprot:TRINITY_DN54419_c0_g1_i1.p1 TRINITY_DN54419_c0_g1~~TRINITY_DN54419_c0_g1_i1.p1  ORF type:complete len:615 (-),score=277.66 TRINITY_DN54419_c0_g1_i1:64-1860(-)